MTSTDNERPVLVAWMLIVFGAMWLVWLWKLHSAHVRKQADDTRCHQVYPMLRCTLLVFSVFLSLSALYYITHALMGDTQQATFHSWFTRVGMMMLLLVIFLTQTLYIKNIQNNKQLVDSNCSHRQTVSLVVVGTFALLQVGCGMYVLCV